MSQYGLALHTTSPQLGLALSDFYQEKKIATWELGRDLSTQLHIILQDFLAPYQWWDLALIAVAKGPGSFTGTRMGMATARTLAQQLEIPLFAISTLLGIAAYEQSIAPDLFPDHHLIAVQLPARRQQSFVGIYQVRETGLMTYLSDTIMTAETWEETLATLNQPYQRIKATEEALGKTVSSLLDLAIKDWQQGKSPTLEEAKPFYGQSPV
ncbi:MAG: tRNA (adenosine(37)-N6)-threonylcarbamoyltransferase complex dimerization subunit type 1 TsaB [Halothece sp.]